MARKKKREHDVEITVAGGDPTLTEFFATEIATWLDEMAIGKVTSYSEFSQAANEPRTEGVKKLQTMLAIAKRGITISVEESE